MINRSYGGQIETVSFVKGPKANNKIIRVKPGELAYGSGCSKFSNCFECPLPDCTWNSNENYATRGRK